MSEKPAPSSSADIAKRVLERAIALTWDDTAAQQGSANFESSKWSECVRDSWIRSLREAFAEQYDQRVKEKTVAVFGGKPRSLEDRHHVPSGIGSWGRWEYLYDVAVLAITEVDAAYARDKEDKLLPRRIPFVDGAIWLVESEAALNSTEIAVDASKLRLARAENMLFVAAQTQQKNKAPWLNFLGQALAGCTGNFFLALIPSYASGEDASAHWRDKTGEIALYECTADGSSPKPIGQISFSR